MTDDDFRRIIRDELAAIVQVIGSRVQPKIWYTVAEFAERAEKAPYTVRQWCNVGKLNAERTDGGAGGQGEWRISHEEYERVPEGRVAP